MPITSNVIQKNRVVLGGIRRPPNTTEYELEAFWDIGGAPQCPQYPIPSGQK